MDRIRLSLVLVLILVATVFFACQGEAPKTDGDTKAPVTGTEKEGMTKEGPEAAGPTEEGIEGEETTEEPGGIAEEEGTTGDVKEPGKEGTEKGGEPAPAPGDKKEAPKEPPGMAVYKANCVKCHKVSGKPDLGAGALDLAGIKGKFNKDTMREKMSTHPPGGDPYTGTLSAGDLKNLIDFVLSL
jgi:mono/diheme cytochrome c family protein